MNEQARKARERALRKHRKRVRMVGVIAFCAGGALGNILTPKSLPVPPLYHPVVVFTQDDHWRRAYMDENGDFRDTENGMRVGQVYRWKSVE